MATGRSIFTPIVSITGVSCKREIRPTAARIVRSRPAGKTHSAARERPEIGGQPSGYENGAPQQKRSGDELDPARRHDPVGLPDGGFLPDSRLEIHRQNDADKDQPELEDEGAISDISGRLCHPQYKTADELYYQSNPDDRKEPIDRCIGDRLEQPQQPQADNDEEADNKRRAESMNGQRDRPTPQIGSDSIGKF
jgi:hypothetical protein